MAEPSPAAKRTIGKEDEHEHDFTRGNIDGLGNRELYYDSYQDGEQPRLDSLPQREREHFEGKLLQIKNLVQLRDEIEKDAIKKRTQLEDRTMQPLGLALVSWKPTKELMQGDPMALVSSEAEYIYNDEAYLQVEMNLIALKNMLQSRSDLSEARCEICKLLNAWVMVVECNDASAYAAEHLKRTKDSFLFLREKKNRFALVLVLDVVQRRLLQHFYLETKANK